MVDAVAVADETKVAPVGGELPQSATDKLKVELDLSLLIIGGLSGKVLTAAQEMRPYAEALADIFGKGIREPGGIPRPVGYPVTLSVELEEVAGTPARNNSPAIPKNLERTAAYEWLNDNVPLGDDSYRWAVVPNGAGNKVIVSIVKRRGKNS